MFVIILLVELILVECNLSLSLFLKIQIIQGFIEILGLVKRLKFTINLRNLRCRLALGRAATNLESKLRGNLKAILATVAG